MAVVPVLVWPGKGRSPVWVPTQWRLPSTVPLLHQRSLPHPHQSLMRLPQQGVQMPRD